MNQQTQIQNLKMILEGKFDDPQKEEMKNKFIDDLAKFRSHTDFSKFLNKTKTQLDEVFNDYIALKQFSQSKSNEI